MPRKMLQALREDPRSEKIHPAILQITHILTFNERPKDDTKDQRRAVWIEAILAAYSQLSDGGLSKLPGSACWLLSQIIEQRNGDSQWLNDQAIAVLKTVIDKITSGEVSDISAAIETIDTGDDMDKTVRWCATFACNCEDASSAGNLITKMGNLIGQLGYRHEQMIITASRPAMRTQKSFTQDELRHLEQASLRAKWQFYYLCRAKLLDLANPS